MNTLELRDLTVILSLVEENGFAGAAKKLGITQPAVSNQIAKLERKFGFRLFHRRQEGTEITSQGLELLPLIAEIEGESDKLRRRIFYWKRASEAGVKIAVDGSIFSQSIRAAVRSLSLPDGEVWGNFEPKQSWIESLLSYDADLVLSGSFLQAANVPSISTIPIIREKGITCAWNSEYFPLLSADNFDFTAAVSSDLILPADSMCPGFREFLVAWCESNYGIFLDGFIQAETETRAIELCRHGMGVLLLPGSASERLSLRKNGLETQFPFKSLFPDCFTYGLRYRTGEQSAAFLSAIDRISKLGLHEAKMHV